MYELSALLAICEENPPANGGFPSQRPVTRSFNVFGINLNKRLSSVEMPVIWSAITLIVASM